MSTNLLLQPLSIPDKHMDPISNKQEAAIPNMRMGMMGGISSSPTSQHFVEPVSNNLGLHNSPVLNKQVRQMDLLTNPQIGNMQVSLINTQNSRRLIQILRGARPSLLASNPISLDPLNPSNFFFHFLFVHQILNPNTAYLTVSKFIKTPNQRVIGLIRVFTSSFLRCFPRTEWQNSRSHCHR